MKIEALNYIKEYAEMNITCEPGQCADCDVLRHIVVVATTHATEQAVVAELPTRNIGIACNVCGGTEWRCADCQDRQSAKL